MSSQEIISLQFGNFSNFVGSHYWNQQTNLLHCSENTKLFRQTDLNHHYPRLINFDTRHSLGALKEDGTFLKNDECIETAGAQLEENVRIFAQPNVERVDLESESKSWTDFMKYNLHENSLHLLTEHFNEGEQFTFFELGKHEYKKQRDEIEDKLHFWVEECNALEGFQVFTDVHDGFCGITSSYLEDLCSEFNKKSIFSYINVMQSESNCYQDMNLALTLQSMQEYGSLSVLQSTNKSFLSTKNLTPVFIPNMDFQSDSLYSTSSVLAAAVDVTSLPCRHPTQSVSLSEFSFLIGQGVHKFGFSSIGIPANSLLSSLVGGKDFYNDVMTSLGVDILRPYSQVISYQGPLNRIKIDVTADLLQSLGVHSNRFTSNPTSVLQYFAERFYPSTISQCFYLDDTFVAPVCQPYHDVSALSSICTSQTFGDLIRELLVRIQKINLSKHHSLVEFGFDSDSMKNLVEDLNSIMENYLV